MGSIFISYRRNDSTPEAGRLREALIRHFGPYQVFRDRDSITPGERFPLRVQRELSSCDALLAVIGSTWLSIQDDVGQRRLDDPDDYVHLEIATVLARGDEVLVIPVLVGTASMPAGVDLPKPLAALADRQAQPLSEENWDDQVARLTRAVEEVVKPGVAAPLPLPFAAPQPEVTVGAVPRMQQREHAAGTLAESVHLQWKEEAKIRGLFDPDPMPVHWTLTEHNVSDHARHISADPLIMGGSSDRIDELTKQFLTLSRRRLVILGAPGSGKTTLAVQLLLRLLEVRTAVEPVPVLLTANGWDTTAHPRLRDWLAFRLGKDYPALRAIDETMPGELVDSGMVLPVIDGLDELDPAYRPALLSTLNDSLAGTDPLVLTCRTGEYVDAVENADVLTAAAVIEARPLTARDAADYLDSCLPPRQRSGWNPILDTLRRNDDTPLADVCSTPLGLWLLRGVYIENKSDPTPLVDPARYPDADAIKAHLFDELIPALITKRRPVRDGSEPLRPRRGWQPGPTRRWLAYLAVHLRGERDLRWWHLATAVPSRVITTLMVLVGALIAGLIAGPMNGLTLGLVAGLNGGPEFALVRGLELGLVCALVFGPVFGLVFGLMVGRKVRRTPEPGYANLRLRGRGRALARHLVGGLVFGLVFGLTVGLVGTLIGWAEGRGLMGGLAVGLIAGLIGVLLFGLARWVRSPGSNDRSRTPTSTYRGSRNPITLGALLVAMMGVLLVVGMLIGGLAHLGVNLFAGLMWVLPPVTVVGLAVGLARWVRSPGSTDRSRTPTSTYRDSRNLMTLSVLVVVMMVMLVFGLAELAVGDISQPLFVLVFVLMLGLLVGLVVGPMQEPAWVGCVVTSRWLAFRGKLPWKLMGFLDDAHRLGLLRTCGSVYQFRHAELQDHLAKSRGDRSTRPTEMTDDAEGSKLSS